MYAFDPVDRPPWDWCGHPCLH